MIPLLFMHLIYVYVISHVGVGLHLPPRQVRSLIYVYVVSHVGIGLHLSPRQVSRVGPGHGRAYVGPDDMHIISCHIHHSPKRSV